jgi:glucokinase
MRVLAGDIGGTKTRLAVFDVGGRRLKTVTQQNYPSSQYSGLEDIIRDFLDHSDANCRLACFGIAGPVQHGRVATTNLPWVVDEQTLASLFGFECVTLINDLEANAWGIGALGPDDFCLLNTGVPDAEGNACIISAGTGLGEAGLYWDGQRHWPFACEGGHADFSPTSDLEIALLNYLRARFGHVSWERVLSGMGLVNVHDFLRQHRGEPTPSWLRAEMATGDPAAAISRAALGDRDALCLEALDFSIYLYGVEAGNLALKLMATGGVYLGGGMGPKNLERLRGPLFMQGFLNKGRMQPLLKAMPVKLIVNDHTALFGPALYLAAMKNGMNAPAGQ